MPIDPPGVPRAAGWWVGVIGILALMVMIAIITMRNATHPTGYRCWHRPGPWTYPTDAIVTWLSIMATEALAIGLVLRWRTTMSLVNRSLILGVVMFLGLYILAPMSMNAGTPVAEQGIWMVAATAWLFVFAIALTIVNLVQRGRRRVAV
ncbi:MAG: hypothetical protein E6J90_37110 [Deltaproteobacteria bacterium]|nr:MAG: hypothetical protein E6J90_37110 [Deltaproteobacteria bacterium]